MQQAAVRGCLSRAAQRSSAAGIHCVRCCPPLLLRVCACVCVCVCPVCGAARSVWPRLAALGRAWPRLAALGRAWPRLAALGRAWSRLVTLGRAWPRLAAFCRAWRLAALGAWPRLALGRAWPRLAALCRASSALPTRVTRGPPHCGSIAASWPLLAALDLASRLWPPHCVCSPHRHIAASPHRRASFAWRFVLCVGVPSFFCTLPRLALFAVLRLLLPPPGARFSAGPRRCV
jgi:hypothetical protein